MDLNKRIEEISAMKLQLAEIKNLRIAVENASKRRSEALNSTKRVNGKIENENDQRRITMLENALKRAEAKLTEANAKFEEAKGKFEKEVLEDVNQELSSYREKGDTLSTEEAGKRWGMSQNATAIDAQNYDNRQRVIQIEAAKAKNEEKYNELDKQLKEAQAKGDLTAVRTLSEEIGKVQADIRVAESLIAQSFVPYKTIEDNQAEYDALFALKTAVEKIHSTKSAYYLEQGLNAEIKAIEEIVEAREESIPAEERYASLKDKKAEVSKNKINAKNLIKSLTDKLAKGEIGKDYVESVRARIEEIKGEMAKYEAQEKEYTEKMQKLEEKYNLKPAPTAMEQYESMQAKYDQLKTMMKSKQAELAKVNEELAKDPDNAELKAKQAALKTDISKLEVGGKKCEEKLAEYKKLLGIEDKGKGEDDGKGKGKGEGEDDGKGKGEDDGKGKGEGEDDGKGKGKGEDDGKGKDGDKGKGADKDGDNSKKVSAADYYSSLGNGAKHKTKVKAWELWKGKKANWFTKTLMWLPRPGMKKLSEQYLEEGWMDPLYEDIKLLGKGEEPELASKPEKKETKSEKKETKQEEKKTKPEEKKSWEVDDKTKDKVKQAEHDAATIESINELLKQLPEDQREAAIQKLQPAMRDVLLKGKQEKKEAPAKSAPEEK